MSTTSAAPSFARSALSWPSPVPERSLTTTLSAPPSGRRSNRSTPAMFIVLAPRDLQALPVGGELELLRGVRAAEDDEVIARTALDEVVAALAVDRVVAEAAEQPLGSGTRAQPVVAGITEQARRLAAREHAEALVDRERVGAGCAVNDDPIERRPPEGELGGTVAADVHLEPGPGARLQPQRDPLALGGPEDAELAAVDARLDLRLGLLRGRMPRGSRCHHEKRDRGDCDCRSECEDACHCRSSLTCRSCFVSQEDLGAHLRGRYRAVTTGAKADRTAVECAAPTASGWSRPGGRCRPR